MKEAKPSSAIKRQLLPLDPSWAAQIAVAMGAGVEDGCNRSVASRRIRRSGQERGLQERHETAGSTTCGMVMTTRDGLQATGSNDLVAEVWVMVALQRAYDRSVAEAEACGQERGRASSRCHLIDVAGVRTAPGSRRILSSNPRRAQRKPRHRFRRRMWSIKHGMRRGYGDGWCESASGSVVDPSGRLEVVSTGYSERSAVAKATKKVTPTFDQYDQFYYKGGNNNPFQTWGIQSAVQINQFTKNKYAEFNTGKMGANGLNTAALNQRLVSAYLSPNRQNVLVVANFAILIDLKENAENGGDLKSVSVVEKAKTEYWNIATKQWDLDPNTKDNNKWVTAPGFKDVVPQDATEPVNKFVDNKGKLLKVPLNAQIGKPVGSTERKLFIGDTPMVEQLYGLKWKSTVLEQVVLKDQMGKVTRVTASFSWDFDPEKIKFDGNGKLDEKSNLAGLFDLGAGNPMIGGENVPVK